MVIRAQMNSHKYAKELGITPNAVRMMMRHGKLSGEYRFDGSKYIFRAPERPRESYDNDHPTITNLTTKKIKKINRGNHFKADYPNDKFRQYNELKMYNKIKKTLPDKVLNEINPELIELAKEKARKKAEDLNKNSFTQPTNYGGPVRSQPRTDMPIYDYDRFRDDLTSPTRTPFRGYDSMGSYDDGSVEVNISRSSSTHNSEPRFANAVEEAIWRNKNTK